MGSDDRRNSVSPHLEGGHLLGVGMQFAAVILVFLFAGYWADRRLGTEPWLLLLGVALGSVLGFYSMYRQLVTVPEQRKQSQGKGTSR